MQATPRATMACVGRPAMSLPSKTMRPRSEEHTSELQSQSNLVCRLLLEKKIDPLSGSPFYLFDPERLDASRIRTIFPCLEGILLRSSSLLQALLSHALTFLSHPQYGITV